MPRASGFCVAVASAGAAPEKTDPLPRLEVDAPENLQFNGPTDPPHIVPHDELK